MLRRQSERIDRRDGGNNAAVELLVHRRHCTGSLGVHAHWATNQHKGFEQKDARQ